MSEWPVDPKLDRRLGDYVLGERARSRRDLEEARPVFAGREVAPPVAALRRSRGGRSRISVSVALLAVAVVIAAVVLRGATAIGPAGGDDASPTPTGSTAASASPASPSASPSPNASPSPSAASETSATIDPLPPKGWASETAAAPGSVVGTLRTVGTPKLGEATAVRLQDGRVLLVGNGAEVFDPAHDNFTVLDRVRHPDGSATLLADGRVLLAGGFDAADKESTAAELFNPSTGKFTSTGPLAAPRCGHTATLLKDGRVLIAGGDIQHTSGEGRYRLSTAEPGVRPGATSEAIATTEIWDPRTGRSTRSGDLTEGRPGPAAALLPDGRVLFAGGGDEGNMATATAEVFDPSTGTSAPTGEMSAPMRGPKAVTLSDGRVLIAGGADDQGRPVPVELFDPSTGRFSVAGQIARGGYAVSALPDDRILVIGGATWTGDGPGETTSSLVFDPKSGKMSPAPSIADLAFVAAAVPLEDGRVLLLEFTSERLLPAQIYTP